MLDGPRDMAAQVKVELRVGIRLGSQDAVQALTRESLTPVPTKITGENTCVVTSTFGEDIYLAMRQGDKYLVGWPAGKDAGLLALACRTISIGSETSTTSGWLLRCDAQSGWP